MTFTSVRNALAISASAVILASCSSKPDAKIELTAENAMERIQSAIDTAKSTEGPGHPAMWTLSDEDTKIYLFGTVHLLPDELKWKTEGFQKAFDSADKLYLEIDQSSLEAQQEVQALVLEHGMFKDGATLSSSLSEEDRATVLAAAQKVGVPMSALDSAMPWFASLQLGLVQIMKSGYNPNAGVEQILTTQAKETGKSFGSFESALDQIKVLSGASLEEQIAGLVFTAKTIDMGKDMLDVIVAEWADGDIKGLSALMGEPSMFGSQEAYEALIVKRNRNWIPQIEAILEDPGVKFVAVGAGHLAGPDSVVTMLRDKGHTVSAVD